jgi:hypothetical protein
MLRLRRYWKIEITKPVNVIWPCYIAIPKTFGHKIEFL